MRLREVRFVGADFSSEGRAHDFLARELEFPHFYGRNLAALADCLGDISHPTRVTLDLCGVTNDRMARFYERMAIVFERVARENPALEVFVIWPDDEE